jgi:hypothetical protein
MLFMFSGLNCFQIKILSLDYSVSDQTLLFDLTKNHLSHTFEKHEFEFTVFVVNMTQLDQKTSFHRFYGFISLADELLKLGNTESGGVLSYPEHKKLYRARHNSFSNYQKW